MNSKKSIYMRAFNQTFFEFMDAAIMTFPENHSIATAKTSAEMIKYANPTTLIRAWYSGVAVPYGTEIYQGDIEFITEKNYATDIEKYPYSDRILEIIEEIRRSMRTLSQEPKQHLLLYIQNLCQLSEQYAVV